MKSRLFLLALLPFSIIAMEKKEKNFEAIYNTFKMDAMRQLSAEERNAISLDEYKANREAGVKALEVFARNTITLAYKDKPISEQKFLKKSKKYAEQVIYLRDVTVGLAKIDVVDEITAKVYALNLLPTEERKYLQCEGYRSDKDKALQAIQHYAQLTGEELEKKKLLTTSKEEYAQKFIEEKVKELNALWL